MTENRKFQHPRPAKARVTSADELIVLPVREWDIAVPGLHSREVSLRSLILLTEHGTRIPRSEYERVFPESNEIPSLD